MGKYSVDLSVVLMVTEKGIPWVVQMVDVMDAPLVDLMACEMDNLMVEKLVGQKDKERVV